MLLNCGTGMMPRLFGGDYALMGNEQIERFAKRLIEQCAKVANDHNEDAEGVHLGVGRAIKDHFGVE